MPAGALYPSWPGRPRTLPARSGGPEVPSDRPIGRTGFRCGLEHRRGATALSPRCCFVSRRLEPLSGRRSREPEQGDGARVAGDERRAAAATRWLAPKCERGRSRCAAHRGQLDRPEAERHRVDRPRQQRHRLGSGTPRPARSRRARSRSASFVFAAGGDDHRAPVLGRVARRLRRSPRRRRSRIDVRPFAKLSRERTRTSVTTAVNTVASASVASALRSDHVPSGSRRAPPRPSRRCRRSSAAC